MKDKYCLSEYIGLCLRSSVEIGSCHWHLVDRGQACFLNSFTYIQFTYASIWYEKKFSAVLCNNLWGEEYTSVVGNIHSIM
jgi:hypothetical protein